MSKAIDFFPTDDASRAIMRNRAAVYANVLHQRQEPIKGVEYVKFTLGEKEIYGIEFAMTRGIVRSSKIKKPPCSPAEICGVMSFQGKLVGVVDLAKFLNVAPANAAVIESGNIIVISRHNMLLGALVGDIQMSDSYHSTSLDNSIMTASEFGKSYIKGIDKGRIAIIDVDKLLASIKVTEGVL